MTLDLKYLERKLDKALKIDNMKHTIKNINGQPMCQAVNPYKFEPHEADNITNYEFYERRLRYKEFHIANPAYPFIHPDPLPDNSIVDGEDLGEPFLQIFDNGHGDSKTSMAISFKHPEMMVEQWQVYNTFENGWAIVENPYKLDSYMVSKIGNYIACHYPVQCVFIRKEQIKSPRLEERRKEISQEAKDMVDNCTPQPDTNFDQLYDILADLKSFKININEAIDLINKTMKNKQDILTFLQFCADNYSIDIPDKVVQEFLESGTAESSEQGYKDDLISRTELIKRLGLDLESLPVNSDYADAQSDGIIRAVNVAKKMPCFTESSEQRYREALENILEEIPKKPKLSLTSGIKDIALKALKPKT